MRSASSRFSAWRGRIHSNRGEGPSRSCSRGELHVRCKLIEIANGVEAVQNGRIHIEKINGRFLFEVKGTPDQYQARIKHAIERGWIIMHKSGTYTKFMQTGADLFA